MCRPSSHGRACDGQKMPIQENEWDYGKVLPHRETNPSPTSCRKLETYSPLCRWCSGSAGAESAKVGRALLRPLVPWAADFKSSSTQIAGEAHQRRQHSPLCARSPPSSCDATFGGPSVLLVDEPSGPCGQSWVVSSGVVRQLPWMWAPTTVHTDLSSRRGHKETLAQSCVQALGPYHGAPANSCRREAGSHRAPGALVPLGLLCGVPGLRRFSWRWQGPSALGSRSRPMGFRLFGSLHSLQGLRPDQGLNPGPGSASPVTTVDCQEAPGCACFMVHILNSLSRRGCIDYILPLPSPQQWTSAFLLLPPSTSFQVLIGRSARLSWETTCGQS